MAAVTSGFIGRERELDEFHGALEETLGSRGRLCLLTGDAGIGKSRLAEEVAGLAADRGVRVLWGRCWHDAGAPAYWPWAQALRTYVLGCSTEQLAALVGRGGAYLAQLVPEITERLGTAAGGPSTDPELARFELFDAVSTFFHRAAATIPLALVLDDLHWADRSSLLLLSFLSRDLADSGLFVLGTYRDVEVETDPESRHLLAEIGRHGVKVPLRGLDEAGVAAFVQRSIGESLTPAVAGRVHDLTGGNPFFVEEVVRLLAAEDRLDEVPDGSFGVPAGVGETIRRRVGLCSAETRQVLTVAATVGTTFSIPLLGAVSELDRSEILEALEEAISVRILSGGVLGSYTFSHALIREAVYQDLPPGRRAELHRRTGEALEQLSGGSVEGHLPEIAHHFFEAALGGRCAPGVTYAMRAAERAITRFAYEEGVEHLKRALRLLELEGGDAERRCRVLVSYGDALWRSGDARSREIFLRAGEEARDVGSATLLAEAALGCGEGLGGLGFSYRADQTLIEQLENALEAIGSSDDVLRTRLLARLAVELYWTGEVERRTRLAEEAVALADLIGDPILQLVALYSQQWACQGPESLEGRLDAADRLVRLAESVGDREMSYRGHAARFAALLEFGDVEGGRAAMEACSGLAEELRMPLYRWHIAAFRAGETLMRGELEAAERLIQEAYELGSAMRSEAPLLMFGAQLGILRVIQGRFEEVIPGLRVTCDTYPWVASWRAGLCWMLQELDPDRDLSDDIDRVDPGDFSALARDGGWLAMLSALAIPCLVAGDRHRAEVSYQMLLPYEHHQMLLDGVAVNFGPVATALGVLATALGRSAQAVHHFEGALRQLERTGNLLFRASTLREYAAALLAGGDLRGARTRLDAALDLMREHGLEGLMGRALGLADRLEQAEAETNMFRREGRGWVVGWSGCAERFGAAKGFGYLHELLRHPGREVHVLDLVALGEGGATPERASLRGDAGPLIDEEAKAAYRRRISELEAEADEAAAFNDLERAAVANQEIDAITAELARGLGLGGRHRRAGSHAERARVNATRAIRSAIARIAEGLPEAGAHLEDAVGTGTFCVYDPPEPVPWVLSKIQP